MSLKKCRLRSPCRCGSTDGLIAPGTGPHLAKLVCWECGKFQKWLKQSDYQKAKRTGLVNSLADIEAIAYSP
jgi:hypothetical protein